MSTGKLRRERENIVIIYTSLIVCDVTVFGVIMECAKGVPCESVDQNSNLEMIELNLPSCVNLFKFTQVELSVC